MKLNKDICKKCVEVGKKFKYGCFWTTGDEDRWNCGNIMCRDWQHVCYKIDSIPSNCHYRFEQTVLGQDGSSAK